MNIKCGIYAIAIENSTIILAIILVIYFTVLLRFSKNSNKYL